VLPDKINAVYRGVKRDSGFEGFRSSQEKGLSDSGIKNKTVAKFRFKFQALAVCAALMTFATTGWGQTTIAQFNFPGTSSLVVSSKDSNLTVSNVSLSAGTIETNITTGTEFPNEPYIEESAGWTATSQASAKNFTFTITAASGYTFSISNISFRALATGSGPSAFGFAVNSTDIYSVNASSGGLVVVNQAVSSQTGLTTATVKIQGWLNGSRTSSGAGVFRLDDIVVTGTVSASSTPALNATVLGSALSTTAGIPSTGVSFTAAGANLNTDITVTPQTGYEVSTTSASAGFGSSAITVANNTSVWVRFAASMALGTYNSATAVVLTGGGASSSANVTTSGSGNNVSPTNDLSSAPTSVTVNGSAANGTTAAATYSTITSDANSKTDVWFSLTATEGGTVTLTTTSTTSQDLDIQAWVGPAAPTSTTGQSVLDGADSGNTSEVATFTAVAGTTYFVRVLQFSGTAGSFTITATMPLSPSNQATSFTSSSITSSSATVGWTRGNGTAGVLVVARAIGAVNADPTNGTTYTANAAFGSGNQIGTGNYVVYKGTGTSVSVTGLSPSTDYYFAVYEYNATGLMHNMAELTGNLTTSSGVVAPSVTTSAATAIGSTTATLNGNPTADNGNAITSRGFVYSTTDATPTIGEAGVTQVSLSGTTGAMSSALTSLGANTVYYFNAYAINGIGTTYGTVQSFTTSQLSAPITSAGDSITSSGFNANWSAVTGATGYQLDVYLFTAPTTTDLIISEYVEGSGNNKYVEIYNGTGSTVTLSNYELRLHSNGAAIGSPTATQNLGALTSGPTTLANGQALVLKYSGAALALPAGVTAYDSTAVNFNGDDALALYKISTTSYVDIFGVIGTDPGTGWTSGSNSTLDKTLRRKSTVSTGVTSNPASFSTLGTEWDQFDVDISSGLGSNAQTTFLAGFQNADAGNNTSLNVTAAAAAQQYSYVVRATSANSTSANSDVRTVTTKGTSSIAVNSGTTSRTYSGSAQGPTFTVTGSTGAVTYSYAGTAGTSYGPSSAAPTNVGSYSVIATAAADTNFGGVASSATAFTIAKATPIISVAPTASAITYGQTLASSTLTGGTASTPGMYAFTTPSTAPNAGTASQNVTFTPTDGANYNTASTSASVTVDKASQTITSLAATDDSKTYGGIYMDFDLTATKGASTSALSYSSSNTGVATIHPTTGSVHIVGAGTTTLTVNQAADANYNAAPAVTQTLTVGKAAITLAADAKSKTYGASDPFLTYTITSGALVVGDSLTGGLSRAAGEDVGTYAISSTLANPNYNISFTGANFTITAANIASSAITLTPAGDGSYTASATGGASFTYSYVGRNQTSYGPSATAPTGAGFYSVTASATGNYSGSKSADFSITGPMAIADSLTKPADNEPYMIPVSELLTNDFRITSTSGATVTTGLSVSAVTGGAGNTASYNVGDRFIQFTPSSGASDTFTYTVTDGVSTATATVTVKTETQAPTFNLQIVKVGTAIFAGGNTTVRHDFIAVPNQTYLIEYATDLNGTWTSAGNQSTGTTGSFSVTFTTSGDVAADWTAHMFFRARLVR